MAFVVTGALTATTCATRAEDVPETFDPPELVYVYDGLGRLRAVGDPDGQTAVYRYDAVGNLTAVDHTPSGELSVIEVVPRQAQVGGEVVVWGTGFDTRPERNQVSFGGVEAEVTAASGFGLTVVVPEGPATGEVLVETAQGSASAADDVRIVEARQPVVEGFSPGNVAPGDEVRIQGRNFTGDPLLDLVVVGGTAYASVTAASATELVVTVPVTARSGLVSVATPHGTARSEEILIVAPMGYEPDEIGGLTPVDLGETSTVEISSGQVELLTFAGTRGEVVDLELSEEGLGCFDLAIGLSDPAGVELIDPHAAPRLGGRSSDPWCGGDDADGPDSLILPTTGTYTITLAARDTAEAEGEVDLTLRGGAPDNEAGDGERAERDDDAGTARGRDADEPDDTSSRGPGEPGDLVAGPGGVLDGVAWLPVDLGSGGLVSEETDMQVGDVLPVALTRSYWPVGDGVSLGATTLDAGEFGRGSALEFDMELRPSSGMQYAELTLPSGLPVLFDRTTEGIDRETAVFAHSTSSTGLFGATLRWSGVGWNLRLPDGTTLEFAPDRPLRALRDRNGNTTTIRRAEEVSDFGQTVPGPVESVTSPTGRGLVFEYDDQGRVVEARNHLGQTVAYRYDDRGRLSRAVSTASGTGGSSGASETFVAVYTYDDQGRIASATRGGGGPQVTVSYDAAGRVAAQQLADGAAFAFSYTTTTRPTGIEGIDVEVVTRAEVTDPRGVLRRVDFDAESGQWTTDARAPGTADEQVVATERDPDTGFVTTRIAPDDVRTGYRYDEEGNVVGITGAAGTRDELLTAFDYDDGTFDPSAITEPTGYTSELAYDDAGNLTRVVAASGIETTLAHDSRGRVIGITDAAGNTSGVDYELAHRVTVTDPGGHSFEEFYDAAGRLAARTGPTGTTTTYAYDGFGQVRSVVDPLEGETVLDYDAVGNLVALTDAGGATTTYTRDAFGRVTSRTDPAGATEQFGYDAVGNLVAHTDRRGVRAALAYDALGRLTVAAYGVDGTGRPGSAESTVRYDYDAVGRLVSVDDSAYGTISLAYDDLDRLVRETTPQGEVTYSYDPGGRRASMAIDDGPVTTYDYDDATGLLATIAQGDTEISMSYDSRGRISQIDLPNAVAADYGYDARAGLVSLDYDVDGRELGDFRYRYDPAGRRRAIDGELASASADLPPDGGSAVDGASYGPGNTLDEAGGGSLTYDAAGNLVSDGTITYTWDARGRLVAVDGVDGGDGGDGDDDGAVQARFVYDPFGRRASKTVDGATTTYTYDGQNVVRTETAPAGDSAGSVAGGAGWSSATYLTGPGLDQVYARIEGGDVTTYVTDAQGSVTGLVGPAGDAATTYSYDPFGATTAHGDDDPNPFTFTGRELDETGLHYYRARYYSSAQGRFISEDPIGFAGGDPNLYAFAGNDPVNLTDPTGLQPFNFAAIAICAAGAFYWMSVVDENFDDLIELNDPEEIVLDPEGHLIELDRINRENLAASEVFITVCSLAFALVPGFGGMVSRGATSFGRSVATRFPNLSTRITTRFPNATSRLGLNPTLTATRLGPEALGSAGTRFGPLNPGPLAQDVAATFRGGTYSGVRAAEPTNLYRVFSDPVRQLGPYWTRTPPSGPVQSIVDSALNPAWGNRATNWVQIRVPAGTTYYEGVAAAQGGLVGGGNQVLLPTVDDAWVVATGVF